ncbi:hypothetical protein SAMN04488511_11939 [Pedobacter suwonensis]|uniref:Uncharacterized protein n=2 Tax=Pedobacter suwonensis TaxID=332999 RepID=A0A1I0U2R1_9SPHI|nr:hypothetical protein SAMN04488511_11939 [Pedobacter suwonensis]
MKCLMMILYCLLISTVLSLLGVFILQTMKVMGTAESDFINLPYGIAVGFNICLAFGTLPILFNLNNRVKFSPLMSGLSFFLLPFMLVLLSLLLMWDELWPGVLFALPYLSVLIIFFMRFRRGQHLKQYHQ